MQDAIASAGIAVSSQATMPATDAVAQASVNGVSRDADRSVQNARVATTSGPSPSTNVTATPGPGLSSIWAATAIIGVSPQRNHVTMLGRARRRTTATPYCAPPASRTAMAIAAHQAGSGWTSATTTASAPTASTLAT